MTLKLFKFYNHLRHTYAVRDNSSTVHTKKYALKLWFLNTVESKAKKETGVLFCDIHLSSLVQRIWLLVTPAVIFYAIFPLFLENNSKIWIIYIDSKYKLVPLSYHWNISFFSIHQHKETKIIHLTMYIWIIFFSLFCITDYIESCLMENGQKKRDWNMMYSLCYKSILANRWVCVTKAYLQTDEHCRWTFLFQSMDYLKALCISLSDHVWLNAIYISECKMLS